MSSFTLLFIIIAIFAYEKRGNIFFVGLVVYITAFLLIILPFFGIYLPLYEEAPWGNTVAAETFYLGCMLLLCGGFLLSFDIYLENQRVVINIRKLPDETKDNIMRSFLCVAGLFFAMNLWDYNGLLMPLYFGYEYAPEPLLLKKIPVLVQFSINSIMMGMWLIIFIFYLNRDGFLKDFKVKTGLFVVLLLIIISAFLILTCRSIPLSYDLQRYVFQPLPAWFIVIPLLIILKSSIAQKKLL